MSRLQKDKRKEKKERYTIVVITSGAYKHAGTKSKVTIEMIGEDNRRTQAHKLDHILKQKFARGSRDVFLIDAIDVGVPLYITLKFGDAIKQDSWACDEVIISYRATETSFPVYDWINDDVNIIRGQALTGALEDAALRHICSVEVERARVKYEWVTPPTEGDIGWKLPRYVNTKSYKELPKIFKQNVVQAQSFADAELEMILSIVKNGIQDYIGRTFNSSAHKLQSLDDFKKLYSTLDDGKDPEFIERWHTDAEFARQQIIGVSPLALKRCESLPDCCNITDSDVFCFLNGNSLEHEMKGERIFIGDYSEVFQGLERNKGPENEELYCPDAIGLFHVDGNKDLMPIAIQLIRNDPESIFTPNPNDENDWDWLLAKMYYRVATANMHEWYYHFFLTHNVMEPFSVALFRNLPRSHPIYKLLRPHLQTVSAINEKARNDLIRPGTIANQVLGISATALARSAFKTFDMADLNFPKVMNERGLDDNELLPKNYFRDDALKLWEIINKFASSIIKIYYESDQDVEKDERIQRFADDVATEGLGWQDGDTKGMQKRISKLDELIHLCTVLMFTSSVSHASGNFPQYQNYQFIPNCPASMRLPPHKKGEGTLERVIDSLPNNKMAALQIALSYLLSQYSPDEHFLGEYPMHLFTENSALAEIKKYRDRVREYFKQVEERNMEAGDDAYVWLGPERVPNSITV